MWKAATDVAHPALAEADDWETDPDFVNDVTEQEQRWGPAGRNVEAIDMAKLREEVFEADKVAKQKQYEQGPKSSYGYGGKFGVQEDRMDKSAVGHDYIGKTEKHVSQTDYAQGFGGKFGVQTDRMDACAVGHEYLEPTQRHASQTDHSRGFGGKFGVQTDRVDKSAAGWEHKEQVEKHPSQKDYSIGFGGKFGVQRDREDASAVGWDHLERAAPHASQVDHKKGFGGKFGVETDRVDKSAHMFDEVEKVGTAYTRHKPDIGGAKPSSIRAKFENMAKEKEQEALQSVQRIRQQREQMDKSLKEKEKERIGKENKDEDVEVKKPVRAPQPEVVKSEVIAEPQADTKTELKTSTKTEERTEEQTNARTEDQAHARTEEQTDVLVTEQVVHNEPPAEQKQNLPDVTLVGAGEAKEEKGECVRQPTVVISPVGWEAEAGDAADDEEDGYAARALYDYQAAATDEISFDPDDLITNIVMIDEGWWQGLCKGAYGLFPANYVQLVDK